MPHDPSAGSGEPSPISGEDHERLRESLGAFSLGDLPELAPFLPEMEDLDDPDEVVAADPTLVDQALAAGAAEPAAPAESAPQA